MGLFGFFSKKDKTNDKTNAGKQEQIIENKVDSLPFDIQLKIFESLGYLFNTSVTKEILDFEIAEKLAWGEMSKKELLENKPFSTLYYLYGWRNPEVPEYNFSEDCLHFDLEFFDPNTQYKWFMERLGAITKGELSFTDISIETDTENFEWIKFKINGKQKIWKLEKTGYIADHFVQRFSYLTDEFNTKGKYTYYGDGGQQWVIDYATEEEQKEFNKVTGLNREWLGEGNHFSEPPNE